MLLTTFAAAADDTLTGIFHPDFRTLTVQLEENRLAPPIITLNSTDNLIIGFDHLAEERQYLRYSIHHCDANWQRSNLVDAEVFDGFNYADVENYEFSNATTTHYVHYTITLPNNDFQFNISGNYLLQVYPEDAPDEIILQARFMVSEGAVTVNGEVSSRTDIDYNKEHQQLSFEVNLNRYPVRDIFNDLRIAVSQNNRTDNMVMVSHPSRVNGSSAIFEHNRNLIFPAGNEYRRIETVQMTYPGMGIDAIEFHNPYYHHFIGVDTPRHSKKYLFDSTQHGRFFVREYNATNSDTEADYAVVHFTLKMLPDPDMDIYLDGDFTHRRFDTNSRMRYDAETGTYQAVKLLKQGAYNYQYLALPQNANNSSAKHSAFANGVSQHASTTQVEGNFYQTVNEYLVAVYYRNPTERFDRLLGYTILFSGK